MKDKIKQFIEVINSLKYYWLFYLCLFFYLFVMVLAFISDWRIGLLLLLLLILSIVFCVLSVMDFINNTNQLAMDLIQRISHTQEDSLYRSPIGILLYDDKERVRWLNPAMQTFFGKEEVLGARFPAIGENFRKVLEFPSDNDWHFFEYKEKYFKVLHQENEQALYFMDVTEEKHIRESRENDYIVFGLLYLDDYNEVIEAMDDSHRASFDAELVNTLNSWTSVQGIYLKRIDIEKFTLIFNVSTLKKLEKEKFKFIRDLADSYYTRNVPISISLGIAYPSEEEYDLLELSREAEQNLDLALGRGGNQVVVKAKNDRARFYGGHRNPIEKRSNVRSRLIYQALESSIKQADNVLISGHKNPDTDAIGSAIGAYKIVEQLDTPVKIILDDQNLNRDVKDLLLLLSKEDLQAKFISPTAAESYVNDKTLLILVDHHRPSLSEAEAFVHDCDTVIIDHHRRGEEFPSRPVLTYIEPYASSASELITEFFMNRQNTKGGVNSFEATALLAGIIVDTNHFTYRTGSRTFDAASYLKNRGADTGEIQRILKEDYTTVTRRNHLIENMELLDKGYAVSKGPDDEVYDNIVAAQAADMILNIQYVEASFVIFRKSEHEIGISARSLGSINVQRIMERLGGGGHFSNAAAQIKDHSIDEVYNMLIETLRVSQEE